MGCRRPAGTGGRTFHGGSASMDPIQDVSNFSDVRRRRRVPLRRRIVALASCLAFAGVAACGQQDRQSGSPTDSTCDGKLSGSTPTYITAWFHDSGGNTVEAQTLREQVNAFNAAEQQVQVKLITLPVGDYARQVQAAAAHGGLPDILDFDGPNLYNYAWSGKLKPIDSCVSQSLREDLLSSIIQQGTYANRLRAGGQHDRVPVQHSAFGALLGVSVHRAQQRINVKEDPLIGPGQQIDPPAKRHQMRPQYRLELTRMPEGELPQQGSDRRRGVHPAKQRSSSPRCGPRRCHRYSPPPHTSPPPRWPAWAPGWPPPS